MYITNEHWYALGLWVWIKPAKTLQQDKANAEQNLSEFDE